MKRLLQTIKNNKRRSVAAVTLLLLSICGSYWLLSRSPRTLLPQALPYTGQAPASGSAVAERLRLQPSVVRLWFAAADFSGFVEVNEEHPLPAAGPQKMRTLATLFFQDQRNPFALKKGQPPPPLDIYRSREGVIYIDLDLQSLALNSSLVNDYYFFSSLAHTLLGNCADCRRLRFLIQGREAMPDAWHLDLSQPFSGSGP